MKEQLEQMRQQLHTLLQQGANIEIIQEASERLDKLVYEIMYQNSLT